MSLIRTHPAGPGAELAGSSRRGRWAGFVLERGKLYTALLFLMLPTLAGLALFTYYPQFSAIKYAFYNWDGQQIEEFRGLANFREALFSDGVFWHTFQLTFILLVANLFKMWPSIFTAIALHRLRNPHFQYIYRVLFVVPMIIPALVWLLVWKSFFEPSYGILNKALNATGLMNVLAWLDVQMPRLAQSLSPALTAADSVFGGVWGMALAGTVLLSAAGGGRRIVRGWLWWIILALAALVVWLALPEKPRPLHGLVWMLAPLTAGILCGGERLGGKFFIWVGSLLVAAAALLILLGMIWTQPVRVFDLGRPAWLGDTPLIIPTLILWGFPWVGSVGVLIYLAGLANISQDVYEAAYLDGLGSVGRLFKLELPLIMTQVRINLIFMTIGTLTDYGLVLMLLGPYGGPGSKGLVPGLYAYQQAFIEGRFGYACALGLVMFLIILFITILYQRYVKVDK